MKVDREIKPQTDAAITGYDPVLKAAHWASLLFVVAAYAVVWSSHGAASREQSVLLVQLHRSIGITLFALTMFRLGWRCLAQIPPLPDRLPLVQKLAARATEYALYFCLLLQPLLGLVNTNARGRRVDLYFVADLPPVVGSDKLLAKQAMAAHEFVGYLLLALIALHAAAALFHHFIRRDDVLRTMLPARHLAE
jgi:cytochrome b561